MTCFVRLALAALLALAAPALAADTLLVVVRHAEKAADDPRDPSLSATGEARAQRLARFLSGVGLQAAYATEFRRTQLTAAPAAKAAGIAVRRYEASGETLPALLHSAHAGEAVLVVGHSNTVPAIVEALAGREVEAIADDQYDRLFLVTLPAEGAPRLVEARY